jgi:citrate/tricarballylate utilization protein
MDRAFILLLLLISISGLGLLIYRDTVYMSIWLVVHLGFVLGLFVTMPYGKFAHGFYRAAALLKNAIEKRQKNTLQLGSD